MITLRRSSQLEVTKKQQVKKVCQKQRTFTCRLTLLLLPHMKHATTLPGDKKILTENNHIKLLYLIEKITCHGHQMTFRCYLQTHFLLPMYLPIFLGLIETSHVQQICNRNMQQNKYCHILTINIHNSNKIIFVAQNIYKSRCIYLMTFYGKCTAFVRSNNCP